MVLILPGGVVFMNRMWSLFSKSFSLKPYAQQSASDTFPRKKSFNWVLSFFGSRSHSSTWGYHRVHLLSLPPVFCAEIIKFLILTSQLGSMEDDLLINSFFFLDYPDILGLRPGSTCLPVVEQLCYGFLVKPSLDPAQSVSYLIVGTLKVSDGHIVAGQCGDPSVA